MPDHRKKVTSLVVRQYLKGPLVVSDNFGKFVSPKLSTYRGGSELDQSCQSFHIKSMSKKFSHLDPEGNPTMVDVGPKQATERLAIARSVVVLDDKIIERLENDEIHTKKGPVFQTAVIAGIMASKKTSELIPLCHPLSLDNCKVDIKLNDQKEVEIICTAKITGKTGVEMEALTGATAAALTIYDMCKGFSHHIIIKETRLMKKTGGKSDFLLGST